MRKGFLALTLSPFSFALSSVGVLLFALCSSAEAQQPGKSARVGLLGGMSASTFADRMKVFRQQLQDLATRRART